MFDENIKIKKYPIFPHKMCKTLKSFNHHSAVCSMKASLEKPKESPPSSYKRDVIPPAATIVSPVMYAASSDAKKATTPAMFSGSPNLANEKNSMNQSQSDKSNKMTETYFRSGTVDSKISFAVSDSCNALANFVRITPGATPFTRILSPAKS